MKVASLTIDNFAAIGHAKLSFADTGLVLIQGVNKADSSANSNGAGKSSIPDALFWCLFGETRKGLSADSVVNRVAGKNCVVEAVIEDGDHTYTVTRWRKINIGGKRAGVSLKVKDASGAEIDLTKGTDKLTQAEINKVLGCDDTIFRAAVYAQQGAMPDLPAMTDAELKRLIEEASGVTILMRAYEIARKRLNAIEREQDSWRVEIVHAENDVTNIQGRVSDLKRRQASFEDERKTQIAVMANNLRTHRDRAARAEVQRNEIDPEAVQRKIDELDRQIAAVHEETERETELSVALTEASAKVMAARSEYNRLVNEAHDLKADLDKIKDRVGQPCSTCGKTYCEEDLADVTRLAKEKLRIGVTRAREKQTDVEELSKVESDAKSALDAFRASRTDVRKTVEERRRLAGLLGDHASASQTYETELAEAKRLRQAILDKREEQNPFGPLVEKAEQELSDALKAHRALEERGAELERRLMVAKDVVKVYGPAGVRAHILDNVTPFLNDRTSTYLGTLSDGNIRAVWSTIQLNAKGEPVEKFAINVEKIDAGDSYAALSGGEQRKVRLACALALQDLVASRATKPIDLWIGDEIDHALDTAGLERLMVVLEQMARERGSVLVISHNALNDWIRETTTVTFEGGRSTVEGSLVIPEDTALAA